MINDQIHEDIRNLIELLPREQREVLVMRHYSDMSFKEIAEQECHCRHAFPEMVPNDYSWTSCLCAGGVKTLA